MIFGLLVPTLVCFSFPHALQCQTETFDILQYTPPKGWSKTVKEGAVVHIREKLFVSGPTQALLTCCQPAEQTI
jgi:hypothetical protein